MIYCRFAVYFRNPGWKRELEAWNQIYIDSDFWQGWVEGRTSGGTTEKRHRIWQFPNHVFVHTAILWGDHRKRQNMTINQPCFCTFCNIVGEPQKNTEYDNSPTIFVHTAILLLLMSYVLMGFCCLMSRSRGGGRMDRYSGIFLSDPGKPGVRSLGPDVTNYIQDVCKT